MKITIAIDDVEQEISINPSKQIAAKSYGEEASECDYIEEPDIHELKEEIKALKELVSQHHDMSLMQDALKYWGDCTICKKYKKERAK